MLNIKKIGTGGFVSTYKIDIQEDKIKNNYPQVLKILLKDRTTRKNIKWATNDYRDKGPLFDAKAEIKISLITGPYSKLIQPRSVKLKESQISRTKEKGEVFTPSWVCNEQNNLIDESWFERKIIFNIAADKKWKTVNEKIIFPLNKTWKQYIDDVRMEITCGEAPYLTSRYDTVTGEFINLKNRIGLLDRKLRIVNENTQTEEDWYKWTKRAFQSVYAYEYQGDNLLIARENLFYTFIENKKLKFNKPASPKELSEIALIISWNIWQMDGLSYDNPMDAHEEYYCQLTLFDTMEVEEFKKDEKKLCKIKDWRANKSITYKSLLERA